MVIQNDGFWFWIFAGKSWEGRTYEFRVHVSLLTVFKIEFVHDTVYCIYTVLFQN